MKLSKAIEIFCVSRVAEGYSTSTLAYYKRYLLRLCRFLDNLDIGEIGSVKNIV